LLDADTRPGVPFVRGGAGDGIDGEGGCAEGGGTAVTLALIGARPTLDVSTRVWGGRGRDKATFIASLDLVGAARRSTERRSPAYQQSRASSSTR
jgi:hypothetical protein